jgi:hypothetical protein
VQKAREYNNNVKFVFLLALTISLGAQPLTVYTELARIDAKGKVTQPATPREILSPAVVRNGFTSFQIVVDAPESASWQLFVAQNPENAVDITLYREAADHLEKVESPTGSGTQVFWMDLWARRGAPVERIKVEPQLNINNDWVIYPIEVRIMDATVPDAPSGGWPVGTASPDEAMRGFVCGSQSAAGQASKEVTLASLRFRNAQQDRALAGQVSKAELQERFGACDATPSDNPESYLRIRDFLFRTK